MDNDFKDNLIKDLYNLAENNEVEFKKMLQDLGIDSKDIKVIDRSKFMVDHIPDAIDELRKKYGNDVPLDNPEIERETRDMIEKKFHESLAIPKMWNVYYLLLHCKIPKKIEFADDIQLVPYGEWSCDDYINVIDRLASSRGPVASNYSEDVWNEIKEKLTDKFGELNPLALLIFNNVKSESHRDALNRTRNHADSITTILSVLTNASIEIKAWLFEGLLNNGLKEIIPDIFVWHYKPVFMDPDNLEIITKQILKKSDNNYLVQLALKYENEALMESEEKYRMLKRWSALEYIADEYVKSTSEELLSKEDRSKIVDFILNTVIDDDSSEIKVKVQNSIGQLNRKNAKDKIRDLLAWCRYPIKELENDKDILDIIYQNRNCITHAGGCYKYDNTKEECKYPAYCKKSDINMFELNRELSRMLKSFIGRRTGIEFKYQKEVPESIKRAYNN